MPSPTATAVLLFTRSAGEEAAHKHFTGQGGRAENAAIAAQLIVRATAVAQQAGVDFVRVESSAQVGRTFGQRLVAALVHHFAQGYAQLIVIGNDCPQLSAALVRQAISRLDTSDAVLGPAADGGVYLLGIKRSSFDATAWALLPWQTSGLDKALAGCLQRAGARVHRLRQLVDVDTAQDLARVLAQLPAGRLRTRLRRLRTVVRRQMPRPFLHSLVVPVPVLPKRGPPAH